MYIYVKNIYKYTLCSYMNGLYIYVRCAYTSYPARIMQQPVYTCTQRIYLRYFFHPKIIIFKG